MYILYHIYRKKRWIKFYNVYMDANFLRPSTEMIEDTDLIMFQESELIGEEDIHNTLQGY